MSRFRLPADQDEHPVDPDALRARYPIAAVAGHCHVAPGRKTDPGPYFDWAALRAHCPGLALPAEVAA